MLKTLHGKLSAALLALLVVVGLLHVLLSFYTTRMYVNEVNQTLNRKLANDLARHLGEKRLLRADPKVRPEVHAEISQSMVLNPDIEIYILDPTGKIKDFSAAPGVVQSKSVALEPIRQFLEKRRSLPILGDDPRHPGHRKIFSVAPIPSAKQNAPQHVKGYIYIILGGDKYDTVAASPQRTYIWRLGLWSIFASLSLVALAGVLLFGYLTRRLRSLTRQMETFQSQSSDAPSTALPGADEIERMRVVFAGMSQRIQSQIAQREADEAQRREAVTNVSHDLRTPIAALQGYLETLLIKEGRLTPDEQRVYLVTATKHAARLGKLVTALFELSRLDSHEMRLALETFSLAELVQDVAQQHEITAREKGVRLSAQLPEDLSLVRADIALVERVLENLIENALRHTPAGGFVRVSLRREDGRVAVVVEDNGEGIAPEDLPRIFERTYRAPQPVAPNSVATNKESNEPEGAGLGLAIAQRIVELHGSRIEAQSVRGQGATFRFGLPLASAVIEK